MADMSKHTPQSLSNSAVIFSLLLGGVVVSLSNSALNPAIPLFMQVFGVPLVSASWVLNAYVIAMAIGLIMVSYLATIFVRKTLYLTALAVFGLGSMMGYFSPSIDWVIGARFLGSSRGDFDSFVGRDIVPNRTTSASRSDDGAVGYGGDVGFGSWSIGWGVLGQVVWMGCVVYYQFAFDGIGMGFGLALSTTSAS